MWAIECAGKKCWHLLCKSAQINTSWMLEEANGNVAMKRHDFFCDGCARYEALKKLS
jgi:hypothetical protein